jgi:CrcB protein
MTTLYVGFWGVLGVLARYGIGKAMIGAGSSQFPWATLLVNVVGSLLIGVLFGLGSNPNHSWLTPELRAGLIVGFLGGFTTFSSFSLETIRLIQGPSPGLGWLYAGVTLLSGFGATWLGLWLAR